MSATPSRVLMLPDWRGDNPYQDLLAGALTAAGWTVTFADYPDGWLPLTKALRAAPDARVVHLHWIGPYLARIFWKTPEWKARIRIALLGLDVLLCRLSGRKVVWTVHNRLSHETPNAARETLARRVIGRTVTRVLFHSASARDDVCSLLGLSRRRTAVVPHGNYIGVYAENPQRSRELRDELELAEGTLPLLFFGALRGYKGLAVLLDAFRKTRDPKLRLVIAGKPYEEEIATQLRSAAAADDRIRLRLGFLPEADVAPLFSLVSAVAVPFERTLTSGSVILAMSLGKALLLPEHARVLDVADDGGAFFFEGTEELSRVLASLSDDRLSAMGQHNLGLAKQLDWQQIARMILGIYDD